MDIPEGSKKIKLIEGALMLIDREYRRLYWNKNHKEADSPFDNSGSQYKNDTFEVRAYDWGDSKPRNPNFQYKGLKIWWYKYLGRGMCGGCDKDVTIEFLEDMLDECIKALRKDFDEKENI